MVVWKVLFVFVLDSIHLTAHFSDKRRVSVTKGLSLVEYASRKKRVSIFGFSLADLARFHLAFVQSVESEVPESAAAVAIQIYTAKHNEPTLILFGVAVHLSDNVCPARTRHFSKYCEGLPRFGIDVEDANVVQTNVLCLDVDVFVSATVKYQKLLLGPCIAKMSHLEVSSRTGWHSLEIIYTRDGHSKV